MAYNPSTNIVVSGKTFTDVPSVLFKTPDGSTVNFAHVGGQIRFSPTLEEQTQNVANYEDVIIDPITSTLLNQLDSDFVAENIKKDVDLFGLLGTLEAGGGSGIVYTSGTLVFSSSIRCDGYELTHGLGQIPQIFIITSKYQANSDYALFFYTEINERLRNVGYDAAKFCYAYSNVGVNFRGRSGMLFNEINTMDENKITFRDADYAYFATGQPYSWIAIGGIAV